ncbi:hypothetical protein Pelo_14170 [Pelomyxa schiedti]|nr:hypothetical protein Pelo_14170 [Pelomyxa schiedti]
MATSRVMSAPVYDDSNSAYLSLMGYCPDVLPLSSAPSYFPEDFPTSSSSSSSFSANDETGPIAPSIRPYPFKTEQNPTAATTTTTPITPTKTAPLEQQQQQRRKRRRTHEVLSISFEGASSIKQSSSPSTSPSSRPNSTPLPGTPSPTLSPNGLLPLPIMGLTAASSSGCSLVGGSGFATSTTSSSSSSQNGRAGPHPPPPLPVMLPVSCCSEKIADELQSQQNFPACSISPEIGSPVLEPTQFYSNIINFPQQLPFLEPLECSTPTINVSPTIPPTHHPGFPATTNSPVLGSPLPQRNFNVQSECPFQSPTMTPLMSPAVPNAAFSCASTLGDLFIDTLSPPSATSGCSSPTSAIVDTLAPTSCQFSDASLPIITLSTYDLFPRRVERMTVNVPSAWRQQRGLSEREIEAQVLASQVCGANGTVGVQCFKCNKVTGSVIEITRLTESSPKSTSSTSTTMERFVFGIKSICTSSAQHLRGPVVISVTFFPGCTVTTAPFNLHSRAKERGMDCRVRQKDRALSPTNRDKLVATSCAPTPYSAPVSVPTITPIPSPAPAQYTPTMVAVVLGGLMPSNSALSADASGSVGFDQLHSPSADSSTAPERGNPSVGNIDNSDFEMLRFITANSQFFHSVRVVTIPECNINLESSVNVNAVCLKDYSVLCDLISQHKVQAVFSSRTWKNLLSDFCDVYSVPFSSNTGTAWCILNSILPHAC